MAMMIYMKVKAKRQGNIEGDCVQPERENTIMCYSMDHQLERPADNQTALPFHHPFKVSTHLGKHTHKLVQACRDAEPLEIEIDIYRQTPNGLEEQYLRVMLTEARIIRTRQWFPTMLLEEHKPYKHMQDITLIYKKISWTYVPEGATVEDTWRELPPIPTPNPQ
jgi:type VI secretion system secreted protein Hcp